MSLIYTKGYRQLPHPLEKSVVTIGNFDGVHRGHQAILQELVRKAVEQSVPAVVYTFRPHPVKLLAPHLAPPLISTYEQKRQLLLAQGVDIIIEEPFSAEFATFSPEKFVHEVLHKTLGAQELFAGVDFTFGRKGLADVHQLRRLGAPYGMELNVLGPFSFEGIVASSTKVREFVLAGNVRGAQILLGRPYSITGNVSQGRQRGRKLGFPTANLMTRQELLPAYGVYACRAEFDGRVENAVVNIGIRPTFEEKDVSIEAHLLDYEGDLYEHELTLNFVEFVRKEKSFRSGEDLVKQIKKDIQKVRNILQVKES